MKKTDLNEKTVAELRTLAEASGLTGYAKLKKAELVDELAAKAKPPSKARSKAMAKAKLTARPKGKAAAKPRAKVKAKAEARPTVKAKAKAAAKPAKKTRAAKVGSPRIGALKKPAGAAAPKTASPKTAPRKAAAPRPRPKRARNPREKAGGDERWEALSPRTARAFSLYRARCEQRVKASKYYLGVQESAELDEGFEFPESYGESAITLMVRDPYWLFAYWELAPNLNAELRDRLGDDALAKSRLVLRVYDVTGTDPEHAASFHDIDVAPGARNWYINVMRVERDYCVDLGLIAPDGSFIVIARSNMVSLPPVGPSEVVDEEWVTLEALGEFYALTELGPSSGSGGWGSGGWGR